MFLLGLTVGLIIGVIVLFIMNKFCRKTTKALKFYFAISFVLGCTFVGLVSDINDAIVEDYEEITNNVINEVNIYRENQIAQIESQKAQREAQRQADRESYNKLFDGAQGVAGALDFFGLGGIASISVSAVRGIIDMFESDSSYDDDYDYVIDEVSEDEIRAEIDRQFYETGWVEFLELVQGLRTIFFIMTLNCVIFIILIELGIFLNQTNSGIDKRMKNILIASVVLKLILCLFFVSIFFFDFVFAFISAIIAKRKKSLDFWTWYVYGLWLGPVALIHILVIIMKKQAIVTEKNGSEVNSITVKEDLKEDVLNTSYKEEKEKVSSVKS